MKCEHDTRKKLTLTADHPDADHIGAGDSYDFVSQMGGYDLCAFAHVTPKRNGRHLITIPQTAHPSIQTDADILGWLVALAQESPVAGGLLSHAMNAGWRVMFSDLDNGSYELDVLDQRLELDHHGVNPSALIRSPYFRHELLTSFLQGLRAIWHEDMSGETIDQLRPDGFLMAARARQADIVTTTLLMAWELRASGYGDLWRHIIGSEDGDMALVFTRTLERDPSAIYSGLAMARAYVAWYQQPSRIAVCDHAALEYLDAVIAEDGAQALGHRSFTVDMAERLTSLPDNAGYMKDRGHEIINKPDFCAFQDPINEAHLFQVMYDSRVVNRGGVPFRDTKLARLIFPDSE
ncbi:MAG: hypothetical protein J0L77_01060 [Alphaproteobacteria bacterium]|nr:hypothetical protein [Alphaproteobacteria bacterium]